MPVNLKLKFSFPVQTTILFTLLPTNQSLNANINSFAPEASFEKLEQA